MSGGGRDGLRVDGRRNVRSLHVKAVGSPLKNRSPVALGATFSDSGCGEMIPRLDFFAMEHIFGTLNPTRSS